MRAVFTAHTHWFKHAKNKRRYKDEEGNSWSTRLASLLIKDTKQGVIKQWSAIAGWPQKCKELLLKIYERAYDNVTFFAKYMYVYFRCYIMRTRNGVNMTSNIVHIHKTWSLHRNLLDWRQRSRLESLKLCIRCECRLARQSWRRIVRGQSTRGLAASSTTSM